MEFKLTENMVLGFLKKGLVYELENCDMEYDMNIPATILGGDEDEKGITIKMNMKIEKFKLEVK